MISDVTLSGRLAEVVDDSTRYVEIDRAIPTEIGGRFQVDRFLIRSFGGKNSVFMKSPVGARIFARGHLENHPQYGVIIVSELQELFPMKPNPLQGNLEVND